MSEPWPLGPAAPVLERGEVHVWQAELDLPPAVLAHIRSALSAEETVRAERFHTQELRDRFTASRGVLRSVLARYLDCKPGDVDLEYTPEGKPVLAADGPHFSLAHSGGLALLALALAPVGVDLELGGPPAEEILPLAGYLAPAAARQLAAAPPEARPALFLRCWTTQEAWVKATGEGLAALDTPLPPGWSQRELAPAAGAAAVVVQGSLEHLRCWQWAAGE